MTTNGITINGRKVTIGDDTFHTDENGRKYRKYAYLKTKPIPVLDYQDQNVEKIISSQHPVILKGSGLVSTANKWTLDYLEENMGHDGKNVFLSESHKFMYFKEKQEYDMKNFVRPTRQVEMTFNEFKNRFHSWKPGQQRLYYQQTLTDTVGRRIYEDFIGFNWKWLEKQVKLYGWNGMTSNLLLIGQPGNVTPVHYDEQQNFFAQVHGYKRVILFHPQYFKSLYSYPFHHPCDRQSQVDFECLDLKKFPLFTHARGLEAVVGPGDVLHIPMYWWHYIESTMDSEITTSINFWYKNTTLTLKDITFPLNWQQKTIMTRNVEKMLGEALGSHTEVGPFLNMLVNGRYPPMEEDTVSDSDD